MKSTKTFYTKRNNSFTLKNLRINIIESNKKREEDYSLSIKNTQSDSSTTEEKKDNKSIKDFFPFKNTNIFRIADLYKNKSISRSNKNRNISTKIKNVKEKININNDINNNTKKIYNNVNNINNNTKNKNTNSKLFISGENKIINSKINNNNPNVKYNFNYNNKFNNINLIDIKDNKYILKKSPPAMNVLYNYKYNSTFKINNCIIDKCSSEIPHVFLNHLLYKEGQNINNYNKTNYLSLSIIQRAKAKKITLLYYRPLKNI
jgi:hypothetical protein